MRVFCEVFSKVNKQAQREGAGKTRVFVDSFGSGSGDVKEGDEGKTTRTTGWKARSALERSNDAAHANTLSYPTSSTSADAALNSCAPSFDAAQADAAAAAAASITTQASEAANAASSNAVKAGAAASAAAFASPFDAAEAYTATSAAYSNAAQACAAAFFEKACCNAQSTTRGRSKGQERSFPQRTKGGSIDLDCCSFQK